VRIDIDRRLKADLAKAADAGATHVYALVEPMAGVFITASVAVAQVSVGADDVNEQMSALRGAAEGVLESGYVELPNLSGIRRRRRAQEALPDLPDAPPLWTTHVDYVLESAPALLLLLLFVTTSDEHADVLVELFDAVAATLHVEGDGDMAWERSARRSEADGRDRPRSLDPRGHHGRLDVVGRRPGAVAPDSPARRPGAGR
jgi:hypothetical protein